MSIETIIEDIKQKARETWDGDEGERRAQRVEALIRKILPNYAQAIGKSELEILEAIENFRIYSVVNYYQDANFPLLDDIKVYQTEDELREIVGKAGFRCPACEGVSSNPYECDAGVVRDGVICNWKAYGLFKTFGKGLRFTIVEKFMEIPKVDEIFMPVAMEQEGETA
jgi:hypothetical protein